MNKASHKRKLREARQMMTEFERNSAKTKNHYLRSKPFESKAWEVRKKERARKVEEQYLAGKNQKMV